MTLVDAELDQNRLFKVQHVVMPATWDYYQRTLELLAESRWKVTFFRDRMELMPPLPEHESIKSNIGRLIELLAMVWEIEAAPFGSTTYSEEEQLAGLEPDECYYFNESAARVVGMKRYDPGIHPPPDLAVEVDITRRVITRLPVCAALRVPEVWRWDATGLQVLVLHEGDYRPSATSRALPRLPMPRFAEWVRELTDSPKKTPVLQRFMKWAEAL